MRSVPLLVLVACGSADPTGGPPQIWLGGALPLTTSLRDVDLDGSLDLVTEHRAEDLTLASGAEVIHFGAFTFGGFRVARTREATFAFTDPDTDGDGIFDACDACPTIGTAPRGPDGCPW